MRPEQERTAGIVQAHGCDSAQLIAILQDIQAAENYLSEANMTLVADMLHISVSRVYSVATFYENFSLEPKGKHIIKVCDGTACHVRKSGPIYDAIHEYLGLEGKKKTSADGVFTLETVACLGACGLAPAMTIDGEVYAKMSPETALAELSFDKCFDYDPSPDAAPLCGLDAPTAVITLAFVNTVGTEATVTLTLGTLREDGTYYATLNDDTTVYLLAQEKVASLLALL